MNMFTAIAESAGNKARATNDQGKTVIVQKQITYDFEKYLSTTPLVRNGGVVIWYYIWVIGRNEDGSETINEGSLENYQSGEVFRKTYLADPEANYWQPI